MDIRTKITNLLEETIADLLYYNRKEDEDLPVGAIEEAITNGDITVEEIVNKFSEELRKHT